MSKLQKIDHIGIAVKDLAKGIDIYKTLLGAGPKHCEDILPDKVKTAFFDVGGTKVELLQATSPESPIARFINKNGNGGIHHISFVVDDIRVKLRELSSKGVTLIDTEPRKGAHDTLVAFIHPKSMAGVLVELVQAKKTV